jgi:hypothetical protein
LILRSAAAKLHPIMPVGHGIMVRGGVAGRSTLIPVFGVLALLLATAALPYIHPASNAGTIEPRGALGETATMAVDVVDVDQPQRR